MYIFSLEWLQVHFIEIIGTLTGIVYVFLSIKQHILLWPLGILSSLFQLIVFYNSKIYADMSLQVYYVVISIYGWYHWVYGKKQNEKKLPVQRLDLIHWTVFLLVTTLIFIAIRFALLRFTDSDVANVDAFTSAFSITATFLLARKYIENWIVWIIVDFCSAGLYIYKGHYFFTFLYAFLAVMSIIGYREWKRELRDCE
jgi:nicotinamide mononucleotide transporter